MKRSLLASVVVAVIPSAQAHAQGILLAFYSFNDTSSTQAVMTATVGSAISSFTNFNAAGSPIAILTSISGNPNNHGFPAGNSVAQNAWLGDSSYFQFTLDATGYSYIALSWAGNVSSTGPTNIVLRYSTTGVGGVFTDFATFATPKNYAITQDLSVVLSINNNPNVVFRLVGLNARAATGTAKIDNFAIESWMIPEPSTVVLVVIGFACLMALRRRLEP